MPRVAAYSNRSARHCQGEHGVASRGSPAYVRSALVNRATIVRASASGEASPSRARQSRRRITALAIARWPPAEPRSPNAWRTTSPAARTQPTLRTETCSSPCTVPDTTDHSAPSTCRKKSANCATSSGKATAPRWEKTTPCTTRSEEHTSELQSRLHLVCRLLLEKKKNRKREADGSQ